MPAPVHTIDLRREPEDRWTEFAAEHAVVVRRLLRAARREAERDYSWAMIKAVDAGFSLLRRLNGAHDYVRELEGFADAAGVDVDDLYLANILYDLTVWGGVASVGCTSMLHSGPPHPMIARNMDWSAPKGIGAESVVFRFVDDVGEYLSVGFPGVIGVVSGISSHGFALTVNQAPGVLTNPFSALNSLPVLWLTRTVFDEAASYRQARTILDANPAASAALYLLAGSAPGEGMLIESDGDDDTVTRVRAGGHIVVANHWLTDDEEDEDDEPGIIDKIIDIFGGDDDDDDEDDDEEDEEEEPDDSQIRYDAMVRRVAGVTAGDTQAAQRALAKAPVLNDDTVHQMVLVPATGTLELRCPQRGDRRYTTYRVGDHGATTPAPRTARLLPAKKKQKE